MPNILIDDNNGIRRLQLAGLEYSSHSVFENSGGLEGIDHP